MEKSEFSKRMKEFEFKSEHILEKDENGFTKNYIIVRLDGHKFSKFTKKFKKPFDDIIVYAMKKTTIDLMKQFKAITGYTQSDEITLFFDKDNFIDFDGRIEKMISLISSYCSIRFNFYIKENLKDFDVGEAYFDARIIELPTLEDVVNTFIFRMKDCYRNSKNNFARTYLSHKECNKKTSEELVSMAKEKGHDYTDSPEYYKYGIFIKKENYFDKEKEAVRSKFIEYSKKFDFKDFDLFICPYLGDRKSVV